jgi:hypothetical protein
MFSKTTLFATLLGFLSLFILGYLFYDVLAGSYFESHLKNMPMNPDMDFMYITLGTLIEAYVLSVLYGKWAAGQYHKNNGFQFGAWIGVFVGFGIGLLFYGTSALMDLESTLVDSLWNIAFYGITGSLIGLGYKISTPKEVKQ